MMAIRSALAMAALAVATCVSAIEEASVVRRERAGDARNAVARDGPTLTCERCR